MKKILINKPIHKAAIELLSQSTGVESSAAAGIRRRFAMLTDINAIILCAGYKMKEKEIEQARDLEVLGRHGAGMDIVDIPAATKRGIPVVFTPLGPTESTAEHAFTLMMAATRKLTYLDREIRKGNFHIRDKVVGF